MFKRFVLLFVFFAIFIPNSTSAIVTESFGGRVLFSDICLNGSVMLAVPPAEITAAVVADAIGVDDAFGDIFTAKNAFLLPSFIHTKSAFNYPFVGQQTVGVVLNIFSPCLAPCPSYLCTLHCPGLPAGICPVPARPVVTSGSSLI